MNTKSDGAEVRAFQVGDRVRATHKPEHDREYDIGFAFDRKLRSGSPGTLTDRSDSHGVCFRVEHDNAGPAWWEPDELTLLPPEVRAVEVADAEIAEVLQAERITDVVPCERAMGTRRALSTLHRMARELQALRAERTEHVRKYEAGAKVWQDMAAKPLSCGHTLGDLIGGKDSVTACGACLQEKRPGVIAGLRADLEQERQARIEAERERDELRARLAALTAPVDVAAEAKRMQRDIRARLLQHAPGDGFQDPDEPRWIEAVRPHVEREAQLRRALTAAEAETKEIDRLHLEAVAELDKHNRRLRAERDAAEERAAKLDAVKVAEVERVLDKHREAFGVQPPQAPSEDDAEERGVPADDAAAVAALAGIDPPCIGCGYTGGMHEPGCVTAQGERERAALDAHLRAAEQKLARLVALAQALFAAQRGDRATTAYEASEALRKYVEAIADDVPPMLTEERARAAMLSVPVDALGAVNYGEGTCATWDDIREEHEDADEDERPSTQYTMICEGAERVRAALINALMAAARGETEPR